MEWDPSLHACPEALEGCQGPVGQAMKVLLLSLPLSIGVPVSYWGLATSTAAVHLPPLGMGSLCTWPLFPSLCVRSTFPSPALEG